MAYAAAREHAHLPAWRAYNVSVKRSGPVVGIWHEAYTVEPESAHITYRNMPTFGMAAALQRARITALENESLKTP